MSQKGRLEPNPQGREVEDGGRQSLAGCGGGVAVGRNPGATLRFF